MTDRVFSWFIVFLLKLIDKEGWRATGLQPASILPKQENGSGWVQAFGVALQALDDEFFGEFVVVVGGGVLGEFLVGLVGEVAAVYEE